MPLQKKVKVIKKKEVIGKKFKKIPKKGAINLGRIKKIKKTKLAKTIPLKVSKKGHWERILAQKIKAIERQVEERKKRELLRNEVKKVAEKIRKEMSGEVLGEFVGGGFGKEVISPAFQLYYHQVWERLKNNWILPAFLIKEAKQLEAIVILKINRKGEIISRHFERPSGNFLFDHSVDEAIKKSTPLPPLPRDYTGNVHEIGVRFRWEKQGR